MLLYRACQSGEHPLESIEEEAPWISKHQGVILSLSDS